MIRVIAKLGCMARIRKSQAGPRWPGAVVIAMAAIASFTAPSASADPTHKTAPGLEECVTHAVYEGNADPLVAFEACTKDSLTGCYRVFRDKYGTQQWALEACKLRD